MVLSILQWNARSLIANGQELKYFIERQNVKPNIVCIQETWLKPSLVFILSGYIALRKDRNPNVGGGVAIFVQQGINYKVLNINEEIEVIGIEVWISKSKFNIINYYNPCKKISREILDSIYVKENVKNILCGDFNAHNTLWESKRNDENGNIIEEFMDDYNLTCLNDGRGTRFDVGHGAESAIDLTIVSDQIAGISQWEVMNDNSLGSDHYPILLKLNNFKVAVEENWYPKWRMREANWEMYKKIASDIFMEIMPNLSNNIEELNSMITNIIYESAEKAICKSTGLKKKKMVHWWNNECKEAIKVRKKAFKKLKINHSFDNLILYKKAQSKVRRTVKLSKKNYWRGFCSTIGMDVKINEIWGMIRKMGGTRRDFSLPEIKDDQCEAITNKEKAEMFARSFVKVHSSKNLSNEELSWRLEMIEDNRDILNRKEIDGSVLDKEFTLFEMNRALIGVKNTSPGKDGICYRMIEHLSDDAKGIILKLYNKVWEQGELPLSWKHSIIVPILKPGKDKGEVKSYRPIALTSNLCKLMERMISRRLMYEIEKRDLLSPYQSGFRSGRTTVDPIACLENEIRKAQVNKEIL